MAEEKAEEKTAPTQEELEAYLRTSYDGLSNEKDRIAWFQKITERVNAQNQEKETLQKQLHEKTEELDARGEVDKQSFQRELIRVLSQLDMPESDHQVDLSGSLQQQLPQFTTILANAADKMENADQKFDENIDASRKRRRVEETPQTESDPPLTNDDQLGRFFV